MQTNPIQIQFNSIQFNSVQRKCNSIQAQFKSNSNSIQLKFNSNTISWNRPNQSNPVHLELDETRCLFEPSGSGGCSPHSERCVRTRKAAQKLSSSGEGGALRDHTSPSSEKTRSELVLRLKTVTSRPSQGQEPRDTIWQGTSPQPSGKASSKVKTEIQLPTSGGGCTASDCATRGDGPASSPPTAPPRTGCSSPLESEAPASTPASRSPAASQASHAPTLDRAFRSAARRNMEPSCPKREP